MIKTGRSNSRQCLKQGIAGWCGQCQGVSIVFALLAASLAGVVQAQSAPQPASPKPPVTLYQKLGIDKAMEQFQGDLPQGDGIRIGHVEGNAGQYMPDGKLIQFSDMTLVSRSGPSQANSHATATSKVIYGQGAAAPGVRHVHFFDTSHWLGKGFLNTLSPRPPARERIDIFTHSWIGNGRQASSQDALRRIDFLVDTYDQLMVVGVNNGAETPVPPVLASGYNSIAVGALQGTSSGGYTQFEGSGRCKPDIVAYHALTSYTTPMVTAVAARLLEKAREMDQQPNAVRAEAIKAIIMAGALKTRKWQAAANHPLDEHLGAGWLKFDKSYRILMGGESQPGPIRNRFGWSFQSSEPQQVKDYRFSLRRRSGRVSVMLVWHRRIAGRWFTDLPSGRTVWDSTPRLADFDLRLVRVDDDGQEQVVAQSASKVDNVEHLFMNALGQGRYRMEVVRRDSLAEAWDYALAWRIEKSR